MGSNMINSVLKSKLLWTLILIIVASIATVNYTESKLQKRDFSEAYNSCHKIWSARGVYGNDGIEQNSLESLEQGFSAGALGVEVDLHYDVEMKQFIISHDHPYKDANGKLVYVQKNGKLLTLGEVFEKFSKKYYFWMDYKNLGKLSSQETSEAIARLLEITQKNSLRERIYIEGTHPFKLAEYTDAGFKTIFDIQPLPQSSFTTKVVVELYKAFFARGGFTVLGMHYGKLDNPTYGDKMKEILGDIPVFLYHVPDDRELLDRLIDNDQIRVMLVGRDINLNRFDRNKCE
jgi:hypothetical protein